MRDLSEETEKAKKDYEKGGYGTIFNGLKPSDCKHCFSSSRGVIGMYYACDKGHMGYPLVMCQDECKDYEKEVE